jgi:hypothetical protein
MIRCAVQAIKRILALASKQGNAYYSVDRRGVYKVGSELTLMRQDPKKRLLYPNSGWFRPEELQDNLARLFPEGLSQHGWHYMVEPLDHRFIDGKRYADHDMSCEIVFEHFRRVDFPKHPSRFQSYFAWEDLEIARAFGESRPIYRIEADRVFRADQNWLSLGGQLVRGSLYAGKYWSGAATPQPKWEILLVPPVRVLEVVA